MSLRRSKHCGKLSEPVLEFGRDAVLNFGFLTYNEFNYTRFKEPFPDRVLAVSGTNLEHGLSRVLYPESIILLYRFKNYFNHTAIRLYPRVFR